MAWAIAPLGIPRELAQERAAMISNVHYELSFDLTDRKDAAPGTERLRFTLKKGGPILLDYRGDNPHHLVINGQATPVESENGHIVLPGSTLRVGENLVSLEFDAAMGPSGKAITRYEDKEDGNVYFYTLFVPMDASMAFPCFDQPDLKGRFQLSVIRLTSDLVVANSEIAVDEG